MKLIQYRFAPKDIENSSCIGDEVQNFFIAVGDVNLCSIQDQMVENEIRKPIKVEDIGSIVSASFEESFSRTIKHERWKSVRSVESCRFVVVEYDGLVRICYKHEDETINFNFASPAISDESELLITTDFFDYL